MWRFGWRVVSDMGAALKQGNSDKPSWPPASPGSELRHTGTAMRTGPHRAAKR